MGLILGSDDGGGGGGITSAVADHIIPFADFDGNSYIEDYPVDGKIAYILYNGNQIAAEPTYDNIANPTTATFDVGEAPVSNVIVGIYN